MTWNLFLSHIWSSAQDQAATIKRQLQLLVPDASIFLDVDDLEDIGALEAYLKETQCVLFILSKGYFGSKNCLREVRACCSAAMPLIGGRRSGHRFPMQAEKPSDAPRSSASKASPQSRQSPQVGLSILCQPTPLFLHLPHNPPYLFLNSH